ncbi:MAG: hypothetical protein U0821_13620 [Chloroflexota bacterium]
MTERGSKYDAIGVHLNGLPRGMDRTTLTFSRIESLVGEPLPKSAHAYEDWWQGKTRWSKVIKRRPWEEAGWVVEDISLAARMVTFRRQA